MNIFVDEDIYRPPDPDKEYQITYFAKSTNVQTKNGYTALIVASRKRHDFVVRMLLDHPNTDTNLQTKLGETALIWASRNRHDNVVRMLLNHHNTDPNLQNKNGFTGLIWASYNRHDIVVRMLLDHPNTNPNLQNKYGDTALILLSYRELLELLQRMDDMKSKGNGMCEYDKLAIMCGNEEYRNIIHGFRWIIT